MFSKPLKEMTDTEVLDALDAVSAEVKRRNSLSGDYELGVDPDALKRAVSEFASAVASGLGSAKPAK